MSIPYIASTSAVQITLAIEVRGPDSRVTRSSKVVVGTVDASNIFIDVNRLIAKAILRVERYCWLAGNEFTQWKLSNVAKHTESGQLVSLPITPGCGFAASGRSK